MMYLLTIMDDLGYVRKRPRYDQSRGTCNFPHYRLDQFNTISTPNKWVTIRYGKTRVVSNVEKVFALVYLILSMADGKK